MIFLGGDFEEIGFLLTKAIAVVWTFAREHSTASCAFHRFR
jgi:hypothetical protein